MSAYPILATAKVVRFESDSLFIPEWFELNDTRPLSFWIRAEKG